MPGRDRASEARPAATLVLLRPGSGGSGDFEVLLTLRPQHLRFMAGATVFPGGAVDPADLHPSWGKASVLGPAEAAAALGSDDPPQALGAFVAALREAFEEVGFLVGEGPLEAIVRSDSTSAESFREACLAAGVRLGTDRLTPAGRWVTPEPAPVRFDASFFCCVVEEGWEPDPDPGEVADAVWMSPQRALDEIGTGARLAAPPTLEMLQRLSRHDDIDAALAAIAEQGVGGSDYVLSVPLSPWVHVVLAPNPGLMTGPGTNTYVLGHDPATVVDPAVPNDIYIEELLSVAGSVDRIVVTHRHPDHVGGIEALVARTGANVRAWGAEPAGGVDVEPLAERARLNVGDVELEVLHLPGHARDHICLWEAKSRSLIAGDNVMGEGTAVIAPPDGDMRAYLDSLRRLDALDVVRVFPGHFRPRDDGAQLIRGYIDHRLERERAILDALATGPMTVNDIVARVYVDVADQLHPIARYSVLAHLQMSADEGRVEERGSRWFRLERD